MCFLSRADSLSPQSPTMPPPLRHPEELSVVQKREDGAVVRGKASGLSMLVSGSPFLPAWPWAGDIPSLLSHPSNEDLFIQQLLLSIYYVPCQAWY